MQGDEDIPQEQMESVQQINQQIHYLPPRVKIKKAIIDF